MMRNNSFDLTVESLAGFAFNLQLKTTGLGSNIHFKLNSADAVSKKVNSNPELKQLKHALESSSAFKEQKIEFPEYGLPNSHVLPQFAQFVSIW